MSVGSYRKYDGANIYEPSVLVWNNYDTTAEWISPPSYYSVGGGGSSYQTMLNVFGSWDNYVYRREPISYTYSAKAKSPDLTIQVLDMDLGPVYNAEVTIVRTGFSETDYTDQNGHANFALLNDNTYTVTINYSTPYYAEENVDMGSVVIDSSLELYTEATFVTTLQKVYFDITDVNGGDYTAGNLVVWDASKGGTVGSNTSLGTDYEEFIWVARSSYETSVQYLNDNYNMASNYVNDTTISPQGNSTAPEGWFNNTGMVDLTGNDYKFVFANSMAIHITILNKIKF